MNENIPMFDWQQIRRFGGDPSRLPEETIFINRPPSAWQQYGGIIVGTLIFILIQLALIVVLLVNVRRRKRVESVLSKSEAEFHAIFEGMFDSVIFADMDRHIRLVNTAFSQLFGYRADEASGRTTEFLYADPADYLDQGRRRFHGGLEIEGGSYELQYQRKEVRCSGPNRTVRGLSAQAARCSALWACTETSPKKGQTKKKKSNSKRNCTRSRKWRPSASSPVGWRMILTICWG